ncbi:hypothetical protein PERCYII29_0836 [Pseudomonas aeruginosa]|nr:hypothetical protein PERCYII29_0836 [Pseudomonas aeruginosa]
MHVYVSLETKKYLGSRCNDYRLRASRKRGFLLSGDRESLSSTHSEKRSPGQGGFVEGARTRVSDFFKVQAPEFR